MKIVYLIALISGLTLTGCYTILEHPDINSKDENGFVYHDDVKFYDDCNSCHNSSDQTIVDSELSESSEPSMYRTHRNERPVRSYHGDVYYSDSYYGDYDNYYNTPWWYEVSQSGSGKNQTNAKEKYRTGSRENTGRNENEREVSRSSNQGGGLNYTSPTRSSNRGSDSSSGSSTSTETTKSSNSGENKSEDRSNSDQPKSRNNDGNRSSGSGRR